MDAEQLMLLLWRIDPMGTCCNVNEDMEDEYSSEARDIGERLAAGEDPRSAVLAVFDGYFWEGCLLADSRIRSFAQIMAELKV